ncbi:MAG TPA: hypothetical protein VE111_09315 [Bradyrhizobium sp.]|nr:hypothetical protein [Bradyrhizobium sp.]
MSDISEKTTDFVRDLGDAARQNPIAATLIGMGVVWLFAGGRTVERAGDFVRGAGFEHLPEAADRTWDVARSGLKSRANSIGEGLASAKDTVQDSATAAFESAGRFGREQANVISDYARSIPGAGAEMLDTARSNLTELFRAQPLALGAIGLAIGAGIAAALPSSEVESAHLGETSDTVKAKATAFASEQTDRATKVAKDVMGAVTEEARKQGLTVEDAKSAVGEISAKVGRVADVAGKGISDRVSSTKSQGTRPS